MAHMIIIVIADKNTLAAPVPACTGVNNEASAFEKNNYSPSKYKKNNKKTYCQWTIIRAWDLYWI